MTSAQRNHLCRLLRAIIIAALALTMALPAPARAAPDLGPAPAETIAVPYLAEAPYPEWTARDRAYLEGVWAAAPADAADPATPATVRATVALASRLLTEVGQLQLAMNQLQSREGYLAQRGYTVYRAQTTGKLLALNWAVRARLILVEYLTGQRTARPGADFYPAANREGDHVFDLASRTRTWAYPDPGKVIDALDHIPVDSAALDGYEDFLLPYAISGSAAGFGGLGRGFVGAHVPNAFSAWDASVSTHEFAHHYSFMYLGYHGDHPGPWDDYVALRGLPSFEDSAEPDQPGWKTSTYEVFAEDFRVLMGDQEAASEPPQTAYGDPRGVAGLADKLRAFFARVQAAHGAPPPLSDLGVGLIGADRIIPQSPIDGGEPEISYALTSRPVLLFFIATDRPDASYWLSKGGEDVQDGWRVALNRGLYFGELHLTAGAGVYKLVLNSGSGSDLLYRAVYIVYDGGNAGAGPAVVAQGSAGQPAVAAASPTELPITDRLVWTSDPRLLLTGDLTGCRIQLERRTPSASGYLMADLGAAGSGSITVYGLTLDAGDGVYRLYYTSGAGASTWATAVLDQPGDPWTPPVVAAGEPVPVTAGAVVLGARRLTVSGDSAEPRVGLFVYDRTGKQLAYAEARRSADGSFLGSVDLPPSAGDLYQVIVATGGTSDHYLTTRWTLAVKVAVAGGTAAGATGATVAGAATTTPDPLAASFESAESALAAGDLRASGADYAGALRLALDRGDPVAQKRAVDGLLAITSGSHDHLAVDAVRSALVTLSPALSPAAAADAQAAAGRSFARVYRRREALKAFTAALAADPSNTAAADGLRLVDDPAYAWCQPGEPPRVFLTRLTDIDLWARAAIERMGFKGVIKGFSDGTFRPDQQVRRDEAVAMVDRVLGLEAEARSRAGDPLPYSDAAAVADWARGYVAAAYAHGLIDLREPRFRPADPATRAEVAVILVRGLGPEADREARAMATERTAFADDARIPAWARGYLAYALKNGIITGYADNTVRPGDPVRRSEMAALAGRIDDRTTTALDSLEVTGTMVKVEPGEPGRIWVRADGEPADSPGAARTLALNPSLYAGGRAVGLGELQPGSRVRLIIGDAGVVAYVEALP